MNCTPIFEKGARRDIVVPERVTVVECVCHGREGAAEGGFIGGRQGGGGYSDAL